MDCSRESAFSLLEKWRKESTTVHFFFKNSHDGWSVNGIGFIEDFESQPSLLLIKFGSADRTLTIDVSVPIDDKSFSRSNPRVVPEGVSFPTYAERESVPYVSESFLSIVIREKTFLMMADVIDDSKFDTV
jgi:hypothetical protein